MLAIFHQLRITKNRNSLEILKIWRENDGFRWCLFHRGVRDHHRISFGFSIRSKLRFFDSKFSRFFFQPMFLLCIFSGSTWETVFQPAKKFTAESMQLSWVVFSCEYTLNWKGYTSQFRAFISTVFSSDFRFQSSFFWWSKIVNLKAEKMSFSDVNTIHPISHNFHDLKHSFAEIRTDWKCAPFRFSAYFVSQNFTSWCAWIYFMSPPIIFDYIETLI